MPKLMTYGDALDKLRRIFPGHEVTVYDGDLGSESGLVEDAEGHSVASFWLTLKEQPAGSLPKVRKIRVGPPGQFNGSLEDARVWQQTHGEPIYLDYNATTPLDSRVLEAMTPWFLTPSNSGSRTHSYGQKAKDAVENARQQIAELLNAPPEEVFFTSGATESNNLAILALAEHGERTGRRHILSTAIEHKAVLELSLGALNPATDGRVKTGSEQLMESCGFGASDEHFSLVVLRSQGLREPVGAFGWF